MRTDPETVVVVRHGETDYREEGRYQGDSERPRLSDRGIRQSIELRQYLRPWKFSEVLVSDLPRAVSTFELLSTALSTNPTAKQLADLREVCVPEWVGMLKKDIPPARLAEWRARPHEYRTDHGERPVADLYERVRRASDLVERVLPDCLVIGHDHVNRALIVTLLGLPHRVHRSFPQGLSAMSILHAEPHHDRFLLHASNLLHESGVSAPVSPTSNSPRLILVRHGVTGANIAHTYQGRMDAALDALGVEQAGRLESLLGGITPSLIVTSELQRAKQTAAELPFAKEIERQVDGRFNEYDYGHWAGLQNDEVQERFPDEYRAWRSVAADQPIRGGEPISHLRARVEAALQSVMSGLGGQDTAVIVAHDIVIRTAITCLLGLTTHHFWKFPIVNGAVTEIELHPELPHVMRRHNVLPGRLEDRADHEFF